MEIFGVFDELSRELTGVNFVPPAALVYNPLEYARRPHNMYWEKFGVGPKKAVLLGMNPGPWGMAQTGVPFGEVSLVRDWMGIEAPVDKPRREHPKRPIQGFSCTRSEVSGKRLWGWAAEKFGDAENFFRDFFVVNYCPLMFMKESGANLTPDKLGAEKLKILIGICDRYLVRSLAYLEPEIVIGVGKFATDRATKALAGSGYRIGRITHPSPANPAANRGWAKIVDAELEALGISDR